MQGAASHRSSGECLLQCPWLQSPQRQTSGVEIWERWHTVTWYTLTVVFVSWKQDCMNICDLSSDPNFVLISKILLESPRKVRDHGNSSFWRSTCTFKQCIQNKVPLRAFLVRKGRLTNFSLVATKEVLMKNKPKFPFHRKNYHASASISILKSFSPIQSVELNVALAICLFLLKLVSTFPFAVESVTFKTLKGLKNKGVKVDLGFPDDMWDTPDAEVTRLKNRVSCDTNNQGRKIKESETDAFRSRKSAS